MPVHYTYFRDHRTFIYEAARLICNARAVFYHPSQAYDLVEDYKDMEKGAEHDPRIRLQAQYLFNVADDEKAEAFEISD